MKALIKHDIEHNGEGKMSNILRVLMLEDQLTDAELIIDELRHAGFDPEWQRCDTEAAYRGHLNRPLDVILADYTLPQFDAPHALRLLKETGVDIPFIVITGTVEEDAVVECMK